MSSQAGVHPQPLAWELLNSLRMTSTGVVSFVIAQLGTDTFSLGALACFTTALTTSPFGWYTEEGFTWVLVAIALIFVAVFAPRRNTNYLLWAAGVGTLGLGTAIYTGNAAWVVAAFAAAAVAAAPRRWAWILLAMAGAAALLPLGQAWTWGNADIDVFTFVQGGATALLQGQNPYEPSFPYAIYTAPFTFYWAQGHYLYGPASVLLAAPGAFAGDVRVMGVVMFIILFAGIVGLASSHPDRRRQWWLVACCVAFPLTATMILHSWVDTYSVALFMLWAYLRRSHPVLASIALGVSFATKFTIVPALIPFWLWSSRVRRESMLAVLVATVITIPFAVATGLADFYHDTVGILSDYLPRFDELTVNGYLYHHGRDSLEGWVGILVVAITCGLILWRKPRDMADAFKSSALIMTVSFLFAQQAAINYYFIPMILLLGALATRGLLLDAPRYIHLPWISRASLIRGLATLRNPLARPVSAPTS